MSAAMYSDSFSVCVSLMCCSIMVVLPTPLVPTITISREFQLIFTCMYLTKSVSVSVSFFLYNAKSLSMLFLALPVISLTNIINCGIKSAVFIENCGFYSAMGSFLFEI